MTARHIHTGQIYEGGRTFISKIIGVDPSTLWRWEIEKNLKSETYHNYEVRFEPVIREKQKKGYAIR